MRFVVLLSGGLDSVVSFKRAVDEGDVALALTFDYGQAAFASELQAATECAARYRVPHRAIDLRWYRELLPRPIAGEGEIHSYRDVITDDRSDLLKEAWVPNRNCVFVAIAAAHAEASGAERVVVGFNREEAEIFPDNSAAFAEAMNSLMAISTLTEVEVVSFTQELSKAEIVAMGARIDAPLDLVYSCYKASSDHLMCGTCQSCVRLKNAFRANNLLDRYAGRFAQ